MTTVARFYIVGLMGIPVQLVTLGLLSKVIQPDLATALAVETAIVHNYLWHQRWTWPDRHGSFWRFNATTGAVSIGMNTIVAKVFTVAGVPLVPANALAIAVCSILTYIAVSRLAFAEPT